MLIASSVPPNRVLQAACDFSERRAEIFPAVSVERLAVHELGETFADVTEGTRAGPVFNWERCRDDWSQPRSVKATVTDSNVYAVPGSRWELTAIPSNGGSQVEMVWVREFSGGPRGRMFGTAFRLLGERIFAKYARDVLKNLGHLEARS